MSTQPPHPQNRRDWLLRSGAAVLGLVAVPRLLRAFPQEPEMAVYKNPSCGCCSKWVEHMTQNGFTASVRDVTDMSGIKARYKVPAAVESCHTAVVQGYVIEGHVPPDVVKKFLAEKPKVIGLAVPGMPIGSPGMEGARKEPYNVLTFDVAGKTAVYARR